MKKLFVIVIAIFLLGGGYFLIAERLSKPSSLTAVQEKTSTDQQKAPPSPAASFNTSDNLDEALQDLDQLDQLDQF